MCCCGGVHYKALMKKNYIIWKRNCCGSCCELLVPILIALLFIVFRKSLTRTDVAETSYIYHQNYLFSSPVPQNADYNEFKPDMIDCWTRKRSDSPTYRIGSVFLIPGNDPVVQRLQTIMSSYVAPKGQQFTFNTNYNTLDDFNNYITGDGYNEDVCFAVNIEKQSSGIYNTRLMFNTTGNQPNQDDIPDTLGPEVIDYKPQYKDTFYDPYFTYGSLQVKTWIDNALLQVLSSNNNAKIDISISPLKQQSYVDDTMASVMQGNMATFLVLPLIVVFLRMSSTIMTEKEKKIREGMRIMGMQDTPFYLSWITWYMIIYTVISIVVTLILKESVYKKSDITLIFVWHWLFSMTLIAQSLFITTFFTNAKLGNIVAMVFYLLMFMFKFIISSNSDATEQANNVAALASQTGLSLASDVFLLVETEGVGIGWKDLGKEVNNFRVGTSIGLFIFNFVFFMLLALYFDQVIPNDFGKKRHPLFFITWMCKKRKQQTNFDLEENANLNIKENIEDVPVSLKQQENQQEVLKMSDVYRIYPNGKKAVSNLSLTMYKNQIFCLLGHNGAGKTSTISMLTGMLEFSQGKAEVFGKDIESEMQDIRQFMGVCPQHDILFPDLSVKEHLELFAVFKGMDSKEIPQAVENAIRDVDLQEKANELSKNLSGGQKRRLSVAIAFIGGSKLIYLDEPTSGMDTSARRYIWDMLKKFKNDKIIVLTTHFMDEADYLGDRIGIMGEGRLICCGSSVFLKNKFGVGYNLTIVKQSTDVSSEPIIDTVMKIIPSANKISDVSQEIAFQLPMSTVTQFEQLFSTFDSQLQALKISTYGISITTLEEVFLKVAHENSEKKSRVSPSSEEQGDNHAKKQEEIEIPLNDQNIDNFDLNSVRIKNPIKLFFAHYFAIIVKRALYFKRDLRGFVCEVFLPCLMVVVGLSLMLISFIRDSPALPITSDMYGNMLMNYGASGQVSQSDLATLINLLPTQLTQNAKQNSTSIPEWDQSSYDNRQLSRKGAYWINLTDNVHLVYKYYTQVQTISRSSPLYFVSFMNQAIINQATNSKDIQINTINYPLRLTAKTKSLKGTADGIVSAFMFSIGLSFIPASLITFIVKERNDMVKHQHLVSGVSLNSYWGANFTIDILKHVFPAVFCMLMVLAYNIDAFTSNQSDYSAVCLLFILYGWAIIPFSYLTSFIFKDYGTAQVTNFFIHFIMGAVGPLVIFILRIINSTHNVGLALGWVFRLIPSFSFGYGVLNVGSRNLYVQKDNINYKTFDLNICGGDILMLSIEGLFYILVVALIEYASHKKGLSQYMTGENKVPYVEKEYDDDVQREMDKIAKSSPSDYTVRVKDLRKVFVPAKDRIKVAVDRVSFGIKQGEVFTLLGVNGAGKTTTFKILSGEILPTDGEAHIAGYSVQNQLAEARQNIGYCPQFDALLENLTAREHLNLYAAIKGIPAEMREHLVEKKLVEMDLKKFEGILAGTFSGGNKRKLSVAIAMLGQPSIVFLDEPSTGMDPVARRFMWTVISRISTINKSSSIILTTHSMEEAEALSTRVAIQVDGVLQCLGTIQEIKHKFGKGYEVEVKIHKPTVQEITELAQRGGIQSLNIRIGPQDLMNVLQRLGCTELFSTIAENQTGHILYKEMNSPNGLSIELLMEYVYIENLGNKIMSFINGTFGNFDIIEHLSDFYRFRIDTHISIGKIFGEFEKNKAALKISEYSLKQATIEQIFNMFAEGKIGINQHLKKQSVIRKNSYQQAQRRMSQQQQDQHQQIMLPIQQQGSRKHTDIEMQYVQNNNQRNH
ncbi:hypothetical protein ABPG72_007707 [Tetrahymena utriculariae]